MAKLEQSSAYAQLAYLLLPESMLFSYDVVNIELAELPKPDPLMTGWLKIYLEEKGEEAWPKASTQQQAIRASDFLQRRYPC